MEPSVAILAQGAMGSGIAARLTAQDVAVRTLLEGRGPASAARAEAAGMRPVSKAEMADVDLLLSIVPPATAIETAERLAPVLAASSRKPVYVDCNAISPDTARAVAAIIAPTGCAFVDAGIVGGPPKQGYDSPVIYASGTAAERFGDLIGPRLDIRVLAAPVGAASALKMCYAGITKGFTAVGAAIALAAESSGAGAELRKELAASQPELAAWLGTTVPRMLPKAYRFAGEMEEIAAFVGGPGEGGDIYRGMARLYEAIAARVERGDTGTLADFFKDPGKPG